MVRLKDLRDRGFELLFRVRRLEPGLVIEERGSGQPGNVQQDREGIVGLEGNDGLNLYRRSCSFKARSFPRYATSARSRSFSRRKRSSSGSSAGGGESGFRGLPLGFGRNPS